MIKKYPAWIFIAVLAILIAAILVLMPGKEKSFEIKDRCGPIMNLISHTIQDESVCKTRCKSQCETMELRYNRIEFQEREIGCHSCTCFCRESFLI